MDEFYKYDTLASGSKGLVYIGDKILVYRRDTNTSSYPLCIDLPGGGPEPDESPFQTFRREVHEEFGLTIERKDIVYARRYPSSLEPGRFAYFPVAKLPSSAFDEIIFGNEGVEFMLMSINDFITSSDVAWPVTQERAKHYLASIG